VKQIPLKLRSYAVNGLTTEKILRLEKSLGFSLPPDYKAFLSVSDGMSIDGGVLVYGSEDLVERNETLEVLKYTPGYVAIGDSGEGSVFLMQLESEDRSVYAVDIGVMDVDFFKKIGNTVEEWMEGGCTFR
jgi:cell wall assembly regulator SMI1